MAAFTPTDRVIIMKVHPIHTSLNCDHAALELVFNRENQRIGSYLHPEQLKLRSQFVESMIKLKETLQYCMEQAEKDSHVMLNAQWREYFAVWFDTLSIDVANAIGHSHEESSGVLENTEVLVSVRAKKFLEVMLPAQKQYQNIVFKLV